jgi:hypothetical protein
MFARLATLEPIKVHGGSDRLMKADGTQEAISSKSRQELLMLRYR